MTAPLSGEPVEYIDYVTRRLKAEGFAFSMHPSLQMPPDPGIVVLESQCPKWLRLFYPADVTPHEELPELAVFALGRVFVAMGDVCERAWTPITTTGVSPEGFLVPEDLVIRRFMATTDSGFRGVRKRLHLSHQLLQATVPEEAVLAVLRMDVTTIETEFLLEEMWSNYRNREPVLCECWRTVDAVKEELVTKFFELLKVK